MIDVDIITGFLGAGKTTFINKLFAEEGVRDTVLVENEFGAVNVDAQLLGGDLMVMPIRSGCICCTLLGDFVSGIRRVAEEYRPGRILVEPSGAAAIADVVAACEKACVGIDARVRSVVTVISAEALPALSFAGGALYRSQIAEAEYIVMSGVEQADEEDLADCRELLAELNPSAPVRWEPWSVLRAGEALREAAAIHRDFPAARKLRLTRGKRLAVEVFAPEAVDESWLAALEERIESGELGQVLRVKGFARHVNGETLLLEYAAGRGVSWRSAASDDGGISVIGTELNHEALAAVFDGA